MSFKRIQDMDDQELREVVEFLVLRLGHMSKEMWHTLNDHSKKIAWVEENIKILITQLGDVTKKEYDLQRASCMAHMDQVEAKTIDHYREEFLNTLHPEDRERVRKLWEEE